MSTQKIFRTSLVALFLLLTVIPSGVYAESGQVTTDTTTILRSAEDDKTAAAAQAQASSSGSAADIAKAQAAAAQASTSNAAAQTASASLAAGGGAPAASSNGGCNLSVGGALTGSINIGQCIINAIGLPILSFSTFILGAAGAIFNLVFVKTVFGFASFIGNSPGLLIAWGILRDLGNMLLLFGFIFIGLATVLNLQTYSAKKAIPQLVIFAILMNFSLFAAEAVIDVSNGLSSSLYAQSNYSSTSCAGLTGTAQATGGGDGSQNTFDSAKEDLENKCLNIGIAGNLMTATGMATIFSYDGVPANYSLTVFLGLSLFAIIGAVVFFAGSFLLVIRALTLTFIMILAPIGFAGMAIPPMRSMAKKWWNALIHQAFFAPIFLLLILVSLKVSESFAGASGNASLAGALSAPNASVMGVLLVFFLVIGLFVGSLIAAKNFGAMGASFAISTAGKITGGATFGAAGWAGRRTIGGTSGFVAKKIRSSRLGTTETGRRAATFFDKGTKKSFDLRATKMADSLKKSTGIDFGKPSKDRGADHGLHGEEEKAIERRTKYAGTLKMSKAQEAIDKDLKKQKKEREDEWKERQKDLRGDVKKLDAIVQENNSVKAEADIQTQIAAARKEAGDAFARGDTPSFKLSSQKATALENSLGQLTEKKRVDTANLAQARAKYEAESSAQEKEVAQIDSAIEANNPQGQYAGNIEHKGRGGIFIGAHVNHEAAKKIRGELKKSKGDKAMDALKKSVDDAAKKGDDVTDKLGQVKEAVDEEAKAAGEDHGGSDHGGGQPAH